VVAVLQVPLYEKWREEMATATEGDLIGSGGDLLVNGMIPPLQIGNSYPILIMTPKAGAEPYVKPFPDAEFLVEAGVYSPLISTTVKDRFGNLMVEITRNHWRVYPQFCPDKNYTKYAFECKDTAGHVLLQVQILPGVPSFPLPHVQVQGEWWSTEERGVRIVVDNSGQGSAIPIILQDQKLDHLIKPLFKYPGKDHWQEFDNH
jgi:hypothetical protein